MAQARTLTSGLCIRASILSEGNAFPGLRSFRNLQSWLKRFFKRITLAARTRRQAFPAVQVCYARIDCSRRSFYGKMPRLGLMRVMSQPTSAPKSAVPFGASAEFCHGIYLGVNDPVVSKYVVVTVTRNRSLATKLATKQFQFFTNIRTAITGIWAAPAIRGC